MLKVGLTGGLASGKTFVAREFEKLGCAVISADRLGHEVLRREGEAFADVVAEFGEEILDADGEINRKALGTIVFADPAKLKKLNSLVHPHVFNKQEKLFAEIAVGDPKAVVVSEAAIMIESGSYSRYDRIVITVCPPDLQIRRYCDRESASEADARARLARQMPLEEKRKYADYVIDTSGTKQETERQVREIHQELLREAA